VRLPVKLGVLDPVDEREAVMVLVRVLDADEPEVAVRERVSVAERDAAARERVGVGESVAEIEAAIRERVGVGESVAEIEAARRDRDGETEIAGTRDLVAVSVTEPDTATECE
jgi:hypothetical protein